MALRVLPSRVRTDLLALYGFARLVDEIGDTAVGDRLALLDAVEADLDRAFAGRARYPLLRRLEPVLAARALPREPFVALIEANRRDQSVSRYPSFDALRGYCRLSANPVGRLVLHVFDAATPERIALSDSICTALQIAEHCQDVAEDRGRGRVYLPAEDMRRFGVREQDLDVCPAPASVRCLVAEQALRARGLLREGAPLVASLRGGARLAVAGFVGGGHAALDALARADYDVHAPRLSPRRRDLLRRAAGEWWRARGGEA